MELVFSSCSALAATGWLLLVVAPRWRMTQVVAGTVIPVAIGLVYLVLIARFMPGAAGGFGSLAEVSALFGHPGLLLAGWVHYLAFDLFIGSWESRDALRRGVPHLVVVPCLLLTFLLGPIGLLAYLGIRLVRTGGASPETA
jgi:hypothetical protein